MRAIIPCVVGLMSVLAPPLARSSESPGFTLKDGDRIVLVGDTLIERDQRYGYLETVLTIQNPDKELIFRNLGWSGDTVRGISRSGFDPPEAGFEQLRQQILAVRPTVAIVGYGMADSFAGKGGLPAFETGLKRLLDVFEGVKARVVLLSPIAHARLGAPRPDPTEHNRDLETYRDAIRQIAKARKCTFVDLFDLLDTVSTSTPPRQTEDARPPTDNGIHLTQEGYWAAAYLIGDRLGQGRAFHVRGLILGHDGKILAEDQTHVSRVEQTSHGLRFEMLDDLLPPPSPRAPNPIAGAPPGASSFEPRRVSFTGLAPGRYDLKVDGRALATAGADGWKAGIVLRRGPEFDQVETLRAAINRKNQLFFDRWRPQNVTYLFGFRKHEQGNNAVEIPRFDPLVAEQEKEIARLRKPVPHAYELVRVEGEVAR